MPELPEVETVRRGLQLGVVGRVVDQVAVGHARAVRRDRNGTTGFAAHLTGRSVTGTRRRGKYLWLPLDSGDALLAHLGMSGQLLLVPPESPDQKHLRVRIGFTDGATGGRELRFVDQRTFGHLTVSPGGAVLPAEIAHIAADPLEAGFDDERFIGALRRRRTGLKRALLDQSLVSGIGNIYADEALWQARLHYARATERMRVGEVRELLAAVRQVLTGSLAAGGTSFDALYVSAEGMSGLFERELAVYGRAGQPCLRCAAPIRREPFMNRSSFRCPRCQPRPRLGRW